MRSQILFDGSNFKPLNAFDQYLDMDLGLDLALARLLAVTLETVPNGVFRCRFWMI